MATPAWWTIHCPKASQFDCPYTGIYAAMCDAVIDNGRMDFCTMRGSGNVSTIFIYVSEVPFKLQLLLYWYTYASIVCCCSFVPVKLSKSFWCPLYQQTYIYIKALHQLGATLDKLLSWDGSQSRSVLRTHESVWKYLVERYCLPIKCTLTYNSKA